MDILKVLENRYSTKQFDQSKKLDKGQLQVIEQLLQKSPSSTNIQPWHFLITTTDEGKKRVAKGAQDFYAFNESKILNASAVIVFATQIDPTRMHLEDVLNQEASDGRFIQAETKEQTRAVRELFANMHKLDHKDYQHWAEKQVYLNLGQFLLGVATLGLDAIAMEGVNLKVIDEEFSLRDKGFTTSVVVAVGYHEKHDFNKNLPKSRLPITTVIEYVDGE